ARAAARGTSGASTARRASFGAAVTLGAAARPSAASGAADRRRIVRLQDSDVRRARRGFCREDPTVRFAGIRTVVDPVGVHDTHTSVVAARSVAVRVLATEISASVVG